MCAVCVRVSLRAPPAAAARRGALMRQCMLYTPRHCQRSLLRRTNTFTAAESAQIDGRGPRLRSYGRSCGRSCGRGWSSGRRGRASASASRRRGSRLGERLLRRRLLLLLAVLAALPSEVLADLGRAQPPEHPGKSADSADFRKRARGSGGVARLCGQLLQVGASRRVLADGVGRSQQLELPRLFLLPCGFRRGGGRAR